jgi:hypothetical protein
MSDVNLRVYYAPGLRNCNVPLLLQFSHKFNKYPIMMKQPPWFVSILSAGLKSQLRIILFQIPAIPC